jgi:hypothetical protein
MNQNPTLYVTIRFVSLSSGKEVIRKFLISKDDLNDVEWYGGDSGNSFYDDEFQSNEDRFVQRIEDCAHSMLWAFESDDELEPDPDLEGDHPDGLDYNDRLSFEYDLGTFKIEDFFPE